ncbi:hypothetical protein [Ovoidimarina sediminis]|uniref:hypothetical protein n=1 Tax=Ovoidimarina sediminis TaxID=3079856 RepID=UPI00291529EE|nr:hypothetical protein [Rhodophyticola sp. MJ-SS7]MDU8945313.1 hypothetical protein [Rhodophyticola sp. MJ-SS7]
MAILFALNVEKFLIYIVPLAVLWVSVRRSVMSRSFNRLLYVTVALYTCAAISAVDRLDDGSMEMFLATRVLSYGSLWYWLVACTLARTTGSSTAYFADWPTIWQRPPLYGLAPVEARGIDDTSWENLHHSHARLAARSTQSGRDAAMPAEPGTA